MEFDTNNRRESDRGERKSAALYGSTDSTTAPTSTARSLVPGMVACAARPSTTVPQPCLKYIYIKSNTHRRRGSLVGIADVGQQRGIRRRAARPAIIPRIARHAKTAPRRSAMCRQTVPAACTRGAARTAGETTRASRCGLRDCQWPSRCAASVREIPSRARRHRTTQLRGRAPIQPEWKPSAPRFRVWNATCTEGLAVLVVSS
jgi:hypothetical protein